MAATIGVFESCLRQWNQQAVATDCGVLSLVGVPPSAHGGRGWCVGVGRPRPPRACQQWQLTFQADHTSSRGIPGHASPHSRPLCCIHAAYSGPLHGSILPTPRFSTQPPLALADSHPRQGHPGLIPKEALGWAVLRSLEPTGGGDSSPGAGRPSQMGAPPSAHQSWWVGKGIIMAAPPLLCHSAMVSCYYGVPGFFCRLFQLWSSLLLSLQAVFSQPTAVPSLGPCSKPHFPAPSPPSQQATHNSGWNVQSSGVDHVCSSYFVLPSTDHLLHSPLIPRRSFSVPADFPAVREFF